MDTLHRQFLQILRAALRGQPAESCIDLTEADWQQLFRLAGTHKVLPLVYEAVYTSPSLRGTAMAVSAKRSVLMQASMQAAKTADFVRLYAQLQAAGITPLVVKGAVCRSLYPKPDLRPSSDEDLLIEPEWYTQCDEQLKTFGLQPQTDDEQAAAAYEVPYRGDASPLFIELHRSLFPPESAAYGDWNRFFAHIFERAVPVRLDGVTVYTPAPTDHLFYLICHAFKHFLHSGFGIRQVCDIVLYANRWGCDVDWQRLWEDCCAIRAQTFAATLLRIGQKYLVFDPRAACCPPQWLDAAADETALLDDLLCGGVYGDATPSRKHSSTITLNAVAAQKQGRQAAGAAAALFPTASQLQTAYPYLKQHPWLLPAAWAQRLWRYGWQAFSTPQNTPAQALQLGAERVALLRQYGILD